MVPAAGNLRRVFTAASVGWLLYLLEPLSSPGLSFPEFLLAFWITVFFGVGSLVFVLGRRDGWRRGLAMWLTYPLAACTLAVLFVFSQSPANPLFRVRFLLSRPALNAATSATLLREAPPVPGWVGLFRVYRIDPYPPQEVRYLAGLWDRRRMRARFRCGYAGAGSRQDAPEASGRPVVPPLRCLLGVPC